MGYPPQGLGDDVLQRSKISNDTWVMLVQSQSVKDLRKVLRRILKRKDNQNEGG